MTLFQKFHPTGMAEAAKLGNKALGEHSSYADGEIPDKVLKSRSTHGKFHQPVRPTEPLVIVVGFCFFMLQFIFYFLRTRGGCGVGERRGLLERRNVQ